MVQPIPLRPTDASPQAGSRAAAQPPPRLVKVRAAADRRGARVSAGRDRADRDAAVADAALHRLGAVRR